MASVNKVVLIGNLGRDPEVRYLPDGSAVANVSLATTDKWKDKTSGEQKEATEWHRINFFGRLAEVVGEYLKKGAQVYVEGRLRTRKYEKDGIERYVTEIMGDRMQMLGTRQGGGESEPAPERKAAGKPEAKPAPTKKPAGKFDDFEDDVPF